MAYAAHYTEHDLRSAMQLYKQVMVSHPSDPQAEYSRGQIHNIVDAVVPKPELWCRDFSDASTTRF